MDKKLKILGIGALIIAVMALVVVAFVMGAKEQAKWEAGCKEMGGHIIKDTDTHTSYSYDSKGKMTPHTTTDTTYYCLNENGGILDVR